MAAATWFVFAVILSSGCGGQGSASVPPKVPRSLVPDAVADGRLRFYPKSDGKTLEAFAQAGQRSLIGDAALWELRDGERLIGALQVTTVVDRVDLAEPIDRESLLRQILPGTVNRLAVGDLPVWLTEADDKVTFVWFGRDIFLVLQLKGRGFEPEKVVVELVRYQRKRTAWHDLPPESYERSD